MKIILDLDNIGQFHQAGTAYMEVTRDVPNQLVGEEVGVLVQGNKFLVTRNQGSYTVKAGK